MVTTPIPVGSRYPWLRSYAGWLRHHGIRHAEAETMMRRRWEACEQPADYPMPWADAQALLADMFGRYPAGDEAPPVAVLDDAQWEQAAGFARRVELAAHDLRVRDAARDKVAAEKSATVVLPGLTRLDNFLAVPDEAATYRVAGLWPTGGRVVLSAQHKAGKTTLTANLVRALVDGKPFLDAFDVLPTGRVVIVDDELDERMLRRWLRDQGIVNTHRVTVLPLRGRLSSFNILDPTTRTRWAEHLGAGDVLLLDCLRPALDALGLSEDKDAGRFLEALDELTTEAGIAETLVVHHMGHVGERSRGDSRILDWPDAVWKLVRDAEDDDTTSAGSVRRYLTGYGRDVDQAETLLAFNPATRHLSVAGGSRRDRKVDEAVEAVLDTIRDYGEPLSGRQIEARLRDTGPGRDTVRAALKRAVNDGDVLITEGANNAKLHSLNPSSARVRGSARPVRGRTENECAGGPIGPRAHSLTDGDLAEVGNPRTQPADDHSTPRDDLVSDPAPDATISSSTATATATAQPAAEQTGCRRPAEPTETCPGCHHWTAVSNLEQNGTGVCGTCTRAGRTARPPQAVEAMRPW